MEASPATFWHPSADKELQLLHLSMQPDESFLPINCREDDLESAFSTAANDRISIEKVRVPNGEIPNHDIDEYDAAVIGGASFNIADNRHDFRSIQSIIRKAIDAKIPLIGICLGHQLIAKELGGTVEEGKKGPQMHVATMQKTSAGKTASILQGIPDTFSSASNHRDVVSRLPSGSTELAFGDYPNQIVEFSPNVWGMQFHPERSKNTMIRLYASKHTGNRRIETLMDLHRMDKQPSKQLLSNFMSLASTQRSSHQT